MTSKKSDVSRSTGGGALANLFSRPKTEYVEKQGEDIRIAPGERDLIYIRKCSQCKFTVQGKAAKCIIESSTDVKVEFEECLIAGTLEMMGSQDVTISINPQDKLPTVSAERCKNVHVYYYEPQAFGSFFTVECTNITIHFQPPHVEEYVLDLPDDKLNQFVSELNSGRMIISKVIREGAGYATTVQKQRIAEMNEEEMKSQVLTYLERIVTITPAKPKAAAVNGTQPTPPIKPEAAPAMSTPEVTTPSTGSTSVSAQDQHTLNSNQSSREAGCVNSTTPQADPKEDPLATALQAKKKDLKPTETVERSLPVVGVGKGGGGGGRYNIEDEESKKEYFDNGDELAKKLDRVSQWVKSSKHVIVFTGAGISTSAGIPDFRSGMDTVLETGPGVWELMAKEASRQKGRVITPILQALPTPTHMAIVQLQETDVIKFTVSQNIDGLHRRSGLGPSQLAELHGNTNLEACQKCHRQYLRDFETREAVHVFDHKTSRCCDDPDCRGCLIDSIVNFGENLPDYELKTAFEHAQKADLCIVLGSSLRVRPACQVPEVVQQNGGKVVICNLQKIPQFPDDNRTMQVFAKCDDFMSGLIEQLGQRIPSFTLKRRARITMETKDGGGVQVSVRGLDRDEDVPYSFIKSVSVVQQGSGDLQQVTKEPLVLTLSPPIATPLNVVLQFHGHYGEPPLSISCPPSEGSKVYSMTYDPLSRKWEVKEE